jgi:hypothetical protein
MQPIFEHIYLHLNYKMKKYNPFFVCKNLYSLKRFSLKEQPVFVHTYTEAS